MKRRDRRKIRTAKHVVTFHRRGGLDFGLVGCGFFDFNDQAEIKMPVVQAQNNRCIAARNHWENSDNIGIVRIVDARFQPERPHDQIAKLHQAHDPSGTRFHNLAGGDVRRDPGLGCGDRKTVRPVGTRQGRVGQFDRACRRSNFNDQVSE